MLPVKTSCKDYWVLWMSCHYKYWIESLESLSCSPPSRGLTGTLPPTKLSNLKQKSMGLMDLSLGRGSSLLAWAKRWEHSLGHFGTLLGRCCSCLSFCQFLVNKSALQSWVWLIDCLPSLRVENTSLHFPPNCFFFLPLKDLSLISPNKKLHEIEVAWALCSGSLYSSCGLVLYIEHPHFFSFFLTD